MPEIYPLVPTPVSADSETLQSALDNFIENFYGTVAKSVVDGSVVWTLPCDLTSQIGNYVRDPALGTACYFKDILSDLDSRTGGAESVAEQALAEAEAATTQVATATAAANAAQVTADAAQVDATDALAQLSALGSMSAQDAGSVAVTGGTIDNVTITNLPAPVDGDDAATKSYADALAGGISPRTAVRVKTTGNVNLAAAGATIDGVTMAGGDRVLVASQTAPEENGIYDYAAGVLTRSSDSNTAAELQTNYYYFVSAGSTYAGSGWFILTEPVNLGVDPVVFSQFSASSTYTAGTNLQLSGTQFSLPASLSGVFSFTDTTAASAVGTGAAKFSGGVSVAKKLYVGEPIVAEDTTQATTSGTGSLVVRGGLGLAKNLYTVGYYKQAVASAALASGTVYINESRVVSQTGDAVATNPVANLLLFSTAGANAIGQITGLNMWTEHSGSALASQLQAFSSTSRLGSSGDVQYVRPFVSIVNLAGSGNVRSTGGVEHFYAGTGSVSSTGDIAGFIRGLSVQNIGRATATSVDGVYVADLTKGSGIAAAVRSAMSSGTNKYGLFFDGTADNYLAGKLGIGATPSSTAQIHAGGTLTGMTGGARILVGGTIGTDLVGTYSGVLSQVNTAGGGAGLSTLVHFNAAQGTLTGAVTNQIGFAVNSSLTGATNNYAFRSTLAAGTGRFNLFMDGDAQNYLAGNLGIGGDPVTATKVSISGNLSSARGMDAYAIVLSERPGTTQTQGYYGTYTYPYPQNAVFTLNNWAGHVVSGGLKPAAASITNAMGFWVGSPFGEATNNYAFRGSVTSGAGKWNLYMDGAAPSYILGELMLGSNSDMGDYKLQVTGNSRMAGTLDVTGNSQLQDLLLKSNQINESTTNGLAQVAINYDGYAGLGTQFRDLAVYDGKGAQVAKFTGTDKNLEVNGRLGVGVSPSSLVRAYLSGSATGGTQVAGIYVGETVKSDVTVHYVGHDHLLTTEAAAFTLTASSHFRAAQGTIGAGSTVQYQSGFTADASLIGATLGNYGFRGSIPAGSGRYNLYMDGTAANLLQGELQTGTSRTKHVKAVTNTYTLDTTTKDEIVVLNKASNFTVTLINASNTGRSVTFKNKGAGIVTLDATGLGQIDGSNTLTLNQYDAVTLIADGTTWNVI